MRFCLTYNKLFWRVGQISISPNAQEFWNYRDELTVTQGLIVKGQKTAVPSSLRGEMLEKLHERHLGINKTIARARDVLFWPRMSVEITEKIKNCPVCLQKRPSQQPEPLKSHEKGRESRSCSMTEKQRNCPL